MPCTRNPHSRHLVLSRSGGLRGSEDAVFPEILKDKPEGAPFESGWRDVRREKRCTRWRLLLSMECLGDSHPDPALRLGSQRDGHRAGRAPGIFPDSALWE